MIRKILFTISVVLSSLLGYSQDDSTRYSDGFRFVDGVVHNVTSPVRWKKNDWAKFSLVIAGTGAVSLLDKPIRNAWEPLDNRFLDAVNDVGDFYGKTHAGLICSGGIYLTGLLFKNEWARETGVILGTALFTSGVVQTVLKPVVGRARPYMEEGNYSFHPFNAKRYWHSFPSGHSCMAFTITFVMANRVKSVPLKILFYSLAASTVVCRLYSDVHWASDVAFGGAVGWFSAKSSITRIESMRYRKRHKTTANVYPYPGGLTLRIKL